MKTNSGLKRDSQLESGYCALAALSYFLLHQEANEVKPDTSVHFNLSCREQVCIDLHLSIDLI